MEEETDTALERTEDEENEFDDEDVEMTDEDVELSSIRSGQTGLHELKDNETADEDNDDDDEEQKEDARESTAEEDNDEEEDDDDEDDEERKDSKEKRAAFKIDLSDSGSMLRMIHALPETEARRHEQFRRSHFERGAIKRCMAQAIQECTSSDKKVPIVTQVMAIVMGGMTKIFVGELTREARRIMEKNGETGPIEPRHLREAYRKYYKRRPLLRGRHLRRLMR